MTPETESMIAEVDARAGVHVTKLRQKILDILYDSPIPLSAYDILGRLQSEKRIAPTQIYRAHESLQEAGIVHKLASRPAFMLRNSAPDAAKVSVFMVCRECNRVQESAVSSLAQQLSATVTAAGFRASNPTVEIEGECSDCGSRAL